jgi:hypothetical protein
MCVSAEVLWPERDQNGARIVVALKSQRVGEPGYAELLPRWYACGGGSRGQRSDMNCVAQWRQRKSVRRKPYPETARPSCSTRRL